MYKNKDNNTHKKLFEVTRKLYVKLRDMNKETKNEKKKYIINKLIMKHLFTFMVSYSHLGILYLTNISLDKQTNGQRIYIVEAYKSEQLDLHLKEQPKY